MKTIHIEQLKLVFLFTTHVISDREHVGLHASEPGCHICLILEVDVDVCIVPVSLSEGQVAVAVPLADLALQLWEVSAHVVGNRGGGQVLDSLLGLAVPDVWGDAAVDVAPEHQNLAARVFTLPNKAFIQNPD